MCQRQKSKKNCSWVDFRATKDIDPVLIIDPVNAAFGVWLIAISKHDCVCCLSIAPLQKRGVKETFVMNVMMAFMLSNCIDSVSSGSFTRFVETLAIYAIYILTMTGIDILQKVIKPMYIKKTMVYLKRDIFNISWRRTSEAFLMRIVRSIFLY